MYVVYSGKIKILFFSKIFFLYLLDHRCTVIIAKVREVRENIKGNRLIWRIIQLWYFHHYYIAISHNTI